MGTREGDQGKPPGPQSVALGLGMCWRGWVSTDRALCELHKAAELDCRDAHAKALTGAVLALKGNAEQSTLYGQ